MIVLVQVLVTVYATEEAAKDEAMSVASFLAT